VPARAGLHGVSNWIGACKPEDPVIDWHRVTT